MKSTVARILARKGKSVVTIGPEATVYQAIERMVANNVGAILVMDENEVAGIFTERDYLRRVALEGRTSKTTNITDVMSHQVLCVEPNTTPEACLALMTEKKCRHLPVLRDGDLMGIVSIGDCVKELSEVNAIRAESLTSYIVGAYPH